MRSLSAHRAVPELMIAVFHVSMLMLVAAAGHRTGHNGLRLERTSTSPTETRSWLRDEIKGFLSDWCSPSTLPNSLLHGRQSPKALVAGFLAMSGTVRDPGAVAPLILAPIFINSSLWRTRISKQCLRLSESAVQGAAPSGIFRRKPQGERGTNGLGATRRIFSPTPCSITTRRKKRSRLAHESSRARQYPQKHLCKRQSRCSILGR